MRSPQECAAYMIWSHKSKSRALEFATEHAMSNRFDRIDGIEGATERETYWRQVMDAIRASNTMHE